MSKNPIVLSVFFCLELGALFAMAYWGWTQHDGIGQIIFAFGLPLLTAVIWGVFRVPGEPNDAIVAIPGWMRLLLEFTVFGLSVIFLVLGNQPTSALIFASLTVIIYILSYDRILRFIKPAGVVYSLRLKFQ